MAARRAGALRRCSAARSPQEAIAQLGHGTVREVDPLPGQISADLLPLPLAVIARPARPRDQVIAVTLLRRRQRGQLLRDRERAGRAARTVLANLARLDHAGRQRGEPPCLALLRPQGATAAGALPRLGREIHGQERCAALPGAGDAVSGPSRACACNSFSSP